MGRFYRKIFHALRKVQCVMVWLGVFKGVAGV